MAKAEFKTPQVAFICGVSETMVLNWVAKGLLPKQVRRENGQNILIVPESILRQFLADNGMLEHRLWALSQELLNIHAQQPTTSSGRHHPSNQTKKQS